MDSIKTLFFGLIKPKIYLPHNLSEIRTFIIKHEQTHIKGVIIL